MTKMFSSTSGNETAFSKNSSFVHGCTFDKYPNYSTCHKIPVEVVVAILLIILIANLCGNIVVTIVIILQQKMQTFTNWMILNLALSDIALGLFCIPLEVPLEMNGAKWFYGEVVCVMLYPLQTATVYASVFSLVVLSYSRYHAIVLPFRRQPDIKHAKFFIVGIWVSSFALVSPYMTVLTVDEQDQMCVDTWTLKQAQWYVSDFISIESFSRIIMHH